MPFFLFFLINPSEGVGFISLQKIINFDLFYFPPIYLLFVCLYH